MGTLGHQGIFVISIYFFLLILWHFRLPAFQANIMADYKERQNELKASLESNFQLSFTDKDNRLYCGKTRSKLHEMCVDDYDYGIILGINFLHTLSGTRRANLKDKNVSCAKTNLGAEICLQNNSIYFTRSTFRQTSNKEFWE